MQCREMPKNNRCAPEAVPAAVDSYPCPQVDFCLPFGRHVTFDGGCLNVQEPAALPADGEYGLLVVENGCITDVREAPLPIYTPPPCTPAVTPCDGETGGVNISHASGDLLDYDASGRLTAFLYIDGTNGISVTGSGTADDPLNFQSLIEPNDTYLKSGTPDIITVHGDGSQQNSYIVSHTATNPGPFEGLELDAYGHVKNFIPDQNSLVSVLPGPGLDVTTENRVATVALKAVMENAATVPLGGYTVTVDIYGRMTALARMIELEPGVYDPMAWVFEVDGYGSIVDAQPATRAAEDKFSQLFTAGRTSTQMLINPRWVGSLRISYRGDLGAAADPAAGVGLVSLPTPLVLVVDNVPVSAYAVIVGGRIVGLEAVTTGSYTADQHVIEIRGLSTYTDTAIMDVSVCQL